MPWDEAIACICQSPLEKGWEPGRTVGYHAKTSWMILGEIVRRVDGRRYGRYLREEICRPLGMQNSWCGMTYDRLRSNRHRLGWLFNTGKPWTGDLPPADGSESQAAALRCQPGASTRGPARELGRFYEMLLGGGRLGKARILRPETVTRLTGVERPGALDLTFHHRLNWGMGFLLDSKDYGLETAPYGYGRYCSPATFGHGGRESVTAFADPQFKLVVAAVFNGMPGEARHQRRLRAFCSAVYEDLDLTSHRCELVADDEGQLARVPVAVHAPDETVLVDLYDRLVQRLCHEDRATETL
jgi:CubicO group peptidase (beta-lactamase class C family)